MGILLERILSTGNLNKAYERVYANKGAPGIDGVSIYELKGYIIEHKDNILNDIRQRKYKPTPVKRVEIPKPDGGIRKLGIPTTFDRVIQQAISQVLSKMYEPQFSGNSYGFRPNKNAHQAIERCKEYINDGCHYVVDIDLEKFFDKVNHDKLINIISRTINDGDVVSLIRKYLVSGVMVNGVVVTSDEGTPQGGPLSPLLSNIMLNELDKEILKRGHRFVRYADDVCIYVKSERSAFRVMEKITDYIENKLRLRVNRNKSKVSKFNEIKYLGFGFYLEKGLARSKSSPKISKTPER